MSECETCPTCGADLPGNLVVVDLLNNVLIAGGTSARLTAREAEVCHVLSKNAPRYVTREEIADRIFGNNEEGTASVGNLVRRVRGKIMRAGMPIGIGTSWGLGYRWINHTKKGATP